MGFFFKVEENYRQSIAVSNVTDFWTNQICRRIAAVIVIIISPTPITPNMVTVLSFLLNLFANYQILLGKLGFAALFFFISFIMDCVDGQLARQRNIVTKLGIYLDSVIDGFKDLITYIVLIIYFSETYLFYFSLLAMFNVSASLFLDWVRHTIQQRPKDKKTKEKGMLKSYGIVFWSLPIRNFIIVFSLIFNYPVAIIYYTCFLGTYFTFKKCPEIVCMLKNNDG